MSEKYNLQLNLDEIDFIIKAIDFYQQAIMAMKHEESYEKFRLVNMITYKNIYTQLAEVIK